MRATFFGAFCSRADGKVFAGWLELVLRGCFTSVWLGRVVVLLVEVKLKAGSYIVWASSLFFASMSCMGLLYKWSLTGRGLLVREG